MRLTRVFVAAPLAAGQSLPLPAAAAAHLTRVLRLGPGDACVLFDGRGGEYAARIAHVTRREVVVEVGDHDPVERETSERVLLLQGLARGERMDLIVQKATELGVAAIRPVHTLHSGVRLDADQAARKLQHWRGVAIGACEQCRRNTVPELLAPLPLEQALAATPPGGRFTLSLGTAGAASLPLGRRVPGPVGEWLSVLVGPEGGLSEDEEGLARQAGFSPASLGPRVLRTETAAIAALAILAAQSD
jgi:16S rRNA (uracil1498-N3)-methyltransferase